MVSTSVTADLDALAAELSAFAERFGLRARASGSTGAGCLGLSERSERTWTATSGRPGRQLTTRRSPTCRVRYAAAVDDRDGDAFAELFEADGELRRPRLSGRSAAGRSPARGRPRLARVPEGLCGDTG